MHPKQKGLRMVQPQLWGRGKKSKIGAGGEEEQGNQKYQVETITGKNTTVWVERGDLPRNILHLVLIHPIMNYHFVNMKEFSF